MREGGVYGSEDSIQIDPALVRAVKAKQAVVEWQLYIEEGLLRANRQESLGSLEVAWKQYLSSCRGVAIPPRLSYPSILDEGESQNLPLGIKWPMAAPRAYQEEGHGCSDDQMEAATILMELKYGCVSGEEDRVLT